MITINGKEYRNIQEQVQKNMGDIDELKNRQVYTKAEADDKFATISNLYGNFYTREETDNRFPTESHMNYALGLKQDTLVSGTNIKTVNGNSLLGSGNINISRTNYTAGYGIGINDNDVIAIDQNIVATTSMLNGYLKDNDLNYSGTFRGKAIFVKEEGTYTSTSYGDGSIGRNIPNQPGYSYALPNKSGTFALLDDIPAAVSGVNNGTNWTSITIGNDTYGIPTGGSGSIVAGTGIDITNGVVSVDSDTVVTKDSDGNVNGILQVAHLQSEDWDEDDDCKADIVLGSGLRASSISLETSGEESGSRIFLRGSSATESEGYIDLYGETRVYTSNRIKVYDPDVQGSEDTIAYLSDIPTISGGTGINVNNGVVSVDNTVAMKTDIPAQTKLYAHKISFNITFSGSNNITGIATIISTSSTQITTTTALTTAVRERGVVPASGKYTGSSSANNGRVIELTYGQGSYSQLCAVVVYDYEDIIDVISIAANTVTDTVTQI